MGWREICVTARVLFNFLQESTGKKELSAGRWLGDGACGFRSSSGNVLVRMSSSCGSWKGTNRAPQKGPPAETMSAKLDVADQAVELLGDLDIRPEGISASEIVAELKACAAARTLAAGQNAHSHLMKYGLHSNPWVNSALIQMYASCGSLEAAQTVFDRLTERDPMSWSALILAYAEHGDSWVAIRLYQQMHLESKLPSQVAVVSLFKACSRLGALQQGKLLHTHVIEGGLGSDLFIATTVIDMYAKCGDLEDARKVFDRLMTKSLVTWNVMLSGYAQSGDARVAFLLFDQMQQHGVVPDAVTFVSLLKACSSRAALDRGKLVHAQITERGFESNVFVGSTLIDMYSKCASMEDARCVFDRLATKTLVTWNNMIAGYAHNGEVHAAFVLFHQLQQQGMEANRVTFVSILNACSKAGDLNHGKLVHVQIMAKGLESDIVLGSTLLDLYSKCGSMEDAQRVFDRLERRNSVSWNALIAGYARDGASLKALQLVHEMHQEGMQPDKVTLVSLLQACSGVAALDQGRLLHAGISGTGLESDAFICSALINMYASCGNLDIARGVFDRVSSRNLVVWNTMIAGYTQHDFGQEGLDLFLKMSEESLQTDLVTLVSILKACASEAALELGRVLHGCCLEACFASNEFIRCTITMYCKCGSLEDAHRVFSSLETKDVGLWNVMIGGYAQHGCSQEALALFQEMQQEDIAIDEGTLIIVLKACSNLGALDQGKLVHAWIIECGVESDVVLGNSLIDMYAKCGNLKDAYTVFHKLTGRDLVSWNAIMAGHLQNSEYERCIQLFEAMQEEGIQPDEVTFISMLKACSGLAALNQGKRLYAQILRRGLESKLYLGNCLVDMFAKCGSIQDASDVFHRLPKRALGSWNAMIAGYSQDGAARIALQVFNRMLHEGVQPDRITFLCLLQACSHACQVREADLLLRSMSTEFGILPDMEHYTCMVDLLGRAGHLSEAVKLVQRMPFLPDAIVWLSLLAACQIHGNVERGELAFDNVMRLDPTLSAAYCMMSNIYAEAGLWKDHAELRKLVEDRGVEKEPGRTWMEFENQLHYFVVEDKDHPERKQIYTRLKSMTSNIQNGLVAYKRN